MSEQFDVVVIGAGPAGYPCAIRAAQNKLKAACIDEWKNLDGSYAFGGTCLNAGCIPSKALLESTELYHRAQSEFGAHGIKVGELGFDVSTMQKRKGEDRQGLDAGHHGSLQGGGRHRSTGTRTAARRATVSNTRRATARRRSWSRSMSCLRRDRCRRS